MRHGKFRFHQQGSHDVKPTGARSRTYISFKRTSVDAVRSISSRSHELRASIEWLRGSSISHGANMMIHLEQGRRRVRSSLQPSQPTRMHPSRLRLLCCSAIVFFLSV